MSRARIKIASFYKFIDLDSLEVVQGLSKAVRAKMAEMRILGTVILAAEGVNSTVCGPDREIGEFVDWLSAELGTPLEAKISFTDSPPFRKIDVKVKPEIVTLKVGVDLSLGKGTHIGPNEWNELISDPEVVLLDTRNDYEVRTGTFPRAINPETKKFSDLPAFVSRNLDPAKHKKVAMFCTGGIRCEKFAPYMRSLGFENVFQLDGGILKYLEQVPVEDQLWDGECFVFDTRISVDQSLEPGVSADLSQES